jgi:hypothetical protein
MRWHYDWVSELDADVYGVLVDMMLEEQQERDGPMGEDD